MGGAERVVLSSVLLGLLRCAYLVSSPCSLERNACNLERGGEGSG